MKKLSVHLMSFALLAGALLCTSCNSGGGNEGGDKGGLNITISGPTVVEVGASITLNISLENDIDRVGYDVKSSDPTVATVDQYGVVTGVSVGQVTITVTSRKDNTVSKTYSVEVMGSSIPTLSISHDTGFMSLNENQTRFTANLSNPNNYDEKYSWSSKYGKGTFVGNGSSTQTYRPFVEGSDIIVLDAFVGPYHLQAEYSFLVKTTITADWIAIDSKEDFVNFIEKKTGFDDWNKNYYMTADIDLDGYVSKSYSLADVSFAGTFDGCGHKLSNFSIEGKEEQDSADHTKVTYTNGGLFKKITGAVRNLAIDCTVGEKGSGWGMGALAAANDGIVENCSITVNHTFNNADRADNSGWFAFNSAIAGVGSGDIYDTVVNIVAGDGQATIYADYAYPTGGGEKNPNVAQTIDVRNLYTNTTVIGGQYWEWGSAVRDQSGYHIGIDFASSKKETYALNENIWNLADNEMPTLKVQSV